jgi:succinate dehydrogenase flavin-adding protein (antitoxin of CptAB toxin-antitoxin module)
MSEQFTKKLIYKSHYRGTKEGDLILSSFAKVVLISFSELEKKIYGNLLEFEDVQIYEWALNPTNAPKQFKNVVLEIAKFHKLTTIKQKN